jgi:hypothetical protein
MPRNTSPVEPMGLTLDEFGTKADEHVGRVTGFADAVRAWRKHQDMAAALKTDGDYRMAISAKMDRFIASGSGVADGRRIIVRETGGRPTTVLRSPAVKAAKPELWHRAKVTTSQLVVKHSGAVVPKLSPPRMRTATEVWAAYELAKRRAKDASTAVAEARAVVLGTMAELVDIWDGAPLLTADDWTIGTIVSARFNEALCITIAREQDIDISGLWERTTTPVRRVYALESEGDGESERDEIDGN